MTRFYSFCAITDSQSVPSPQVCPSSTLALGKGKKARACATLPLSCAVNSKGKARGNGMAGCYCPKTLGQCVKCTHAEDGTVSCDKCARSSDLTTAEDGTAICVKRDNGDEEESGDGEESGGGK